MEKEVNALNFRVLSKLPGLHHISSILATIKYAALARYETVGNYWTYLKFRGPLFLVEDKSGHQKLVIMNHYTTENYIFNIPA